MLEPVIPVAELPPYRAGRSAEQVARERRVDTVVKLSSNESPYGPLPSVRRAMVDALPSVNRYPEVTARSLGGALSTLWGVDAERLAVGAGSSGLLWQLSRAYLAPGDGVAFHTPSFEAYPIVARLAGGRPIGVPLRRWCTDVEALEAAVDRTTKLVLIADPHNPTGTSVGPDAIGWLAERLSGRALLVVDEAYDEFRPPGVRSASAACASMPHVVTLRTFSKAHGLAGLRIGYCRAAPDIVDVIERVAPPFAVNSLGLVAARASIDHVAELRSRVREIRAERDRMSGSLRELGATVPESHANFVWIDGLDAPERVAASLETSGVVTRPVAGLGVRVTVGRPRDNDRFLDTFTDSFTTAEEH